MATKLYLNDDRAAVSPGAPLVPMQTNPALFQLVGDFLEWAAREKGLVLCEPYKPQYDWYTPTVYNNRALLERFMTSSAHAQPEPQGGFPSTIRRPASETASPS